MSLISVWMEVNGVLHCVQGTCEVTAAAGGRQKNCSLTDSDAAQGGVIQSYIHIYMYVYITFLTLFCVCLQTFGGQTATGG